MNNTNFKVGTILGLLFMASLLVFNSCKKDKDDFLPPNTGDQWNNSAMTNASFTGQIVKEDGTPLAGATVSTGTHSIVTDADGFFYFSNISTPKNATLLKVQKLGYFKAFKTIQVIPNADNQTMIMIMELPVAETFNASMASTVIIGNGGSIDFPANAIVDAITNQPYTGNVSVFAKWIDPSSNDLALLTPGALRGINNEGSEEGLTTYGMQAVELVGSAGQPLQLGNGQTAQVTFPLPASLSGVAPATVPLWHFDEVQGMWVEDGVATKTGTDYKGAVSHFSFWNCDYGGPIVNFTCQLVDANSNPVNGAIVKIVPTSSTLTPRVSWTNSTGTVMGGIPVNATFDLEYIPAGCGSGAPSTFIQSFSSVTSNVNLGTITVSNSTTPSLVTGTVEDCGNNILANAPVKLKIGSNLLTSTTNALGQFSFSINCVSAITSAVVTAYDPSSAVNGSSTISVNPGTTTNAGTVAACGTQNDFITLNVTNPPATTPTVYTIVEPAGTFSQYFQMETGISGQDNVTNPALPLYADFGFDGPQTVAGVHNLTRYFDSNDSLSSFSPAVVNLTSYGAVGAKISGSFTTTVTGNIYSGATLNCSFRVTRQN